MSLEESGLLQERVMHLLDEHFQLGGRIQMRLPEPEDVYGLLTRADLIVVSDDRSFVVEVKQRLTTDHVARALLVKRMLEVEASPYPNPELVLIAKRIPSKVRSVADEVGVHVLRLDSEVQLPFSSSDRPSRVSKVSHWKSWRVTAELIRSGSTSIRQLSISSGVSYGWTHATVRHLVEMGVAKRGDEGVNIEDIERLFDGVAWERPLSNLLVRRFPVAGEDHMEVARDIEDAMGDWDIEHAFTGFTAGGLYTGYGQRFDRLYIYLDPSAVERVEGSLSEGGGGIELMVYAPDRDVWRDIGPVEGITLASPSQTLLDLIGLGYGARTLAREMWRYHESAADG
jgi:hypothetical protein